MNGTRTAALAAVAALALAGCGGSGSGGGAVAKQSPTTRATAPSASTTTSAPASSGTAATPSKKHRKSAASKKPAAKQKPFAQPDLSARRVKAPRQVRRNAQARERATVELSKLCLKTSSQLPRLPQSADGMPSYARGVLPTARRNASDLRSARTRIARQRVRGIASTYQSLVPLLTQIASRSTSHDEVKTLSRPASQYVMALHTAAVGAGVPRCALPI